MRNAECASQIIKEERLLSSLLAFRLIGRGTASAVVGCPAKMPLCKSIAKPIPLFCFSKKEGEPLPMAMVGGTKEHINSKHLICYSFTLGEMTLKSSRQELSTTRPTGQYLLAILLRRVIFTGRPTTIPIKYKIEVSIFTRNILT